MYNVDLKKNPGTLINNKPYILPVKFYTKPKIESICR